MLNDNLMDQWDLFMSIVMQLNKLTMKFLKNETSRQKFLNSHKNLYDSITLIRCAQYKLQCY